MVGITKEQQQKIIKTAKEWGTDVKSFEGIFKTYQKVHNADFDETYEALSGNEEIKIMTLAEASAKQEKSEKVPTGFYALDNAMGGGMSKGSSVVIAAPSGEGKCHGKGTKILMYDGNVKNIEDVVVGDKLMGDDSNPRNVLKLARGKEMMYKVIQKKGDDYIVNESHLLSLKTNGIINTSRYNGKTTSKRKSKPQIIDISVSDYLKKSKTFKNNFNGYKASVDWKNKKLTIHPYFLGIWLGDGTSKNTSITTMDKEIYDYICCFADKNKLKISVYYQKNNKSNVISIVNQKGKENSLREKLKKLSVWGDKHIPIEYKTGSRKQRLQLLAGLIDTDGYANRKDGLVFSNKKIRLIEDVMFICRSLGLLATKSETYVKGEKYYKVYISGELSIIPVKLNRKKCNKRKQIKDVLHTGIKIEKLKKDDYYGFVLDGNHRYLLGDFTVTHNTAFLVTLSYHFLKSNPVLWFSYEENIADVWDRFKETGVDDSVPAFCPLDITDNKLDYIEKVIKKFKKKNEFFVVFIDQLSFLAPKVQANTDIDKVQGNYAMYLGLISNQIKELAMQYQIIIVFAHQLGRSGDVAYSDMIKHAPDKVIYLKREPAGSNSDEEFTEKTFVIFKKNRPHGSRPRLAMTVKKGLFIPIMSIENYEEEKTGWKKDESGFNFND